MANFSPQGIHDIEMVSAKLGNELESWTAVLRQNAAAGPSTYVPNVPAAYHRIKAGMGRNSDVWLRYLNVPACPEGPILVAAVDGITNSTILDQNVLAPLLKTNRAPSQWDQGAVDPLSVDASSDWFKILESLAAGKTLIFAPGLPHVWMIDTTKYPARSVDRPQTELAVAGPEEAFNEALTTQKAQVRHRIHSPNLLFMDYTVGATQQSTVSVAYLEHLANPALVTTVIERVKAMEVDGVMTSTQIAGLIRDHPRSIFPTVRHTERVDLAVWRLMQGAVLVMLDGDPFVLMAPSPLIDFYRTAMDYSSSWIDTSFVRGIRFLGWILGIYLPALYVAMVEVTPTILPTQLFIITQAASVGLAFPAVFQVFLMILVIETLREAALRLPKPLSTTIGTVGAIVLGTAIVKAGLVNTQIIVMTTLTALSLFSTPVYELASTWRVVNWLMLGAATFLGIVGIVLLTVGLIAVLVDMKSFGVPYFEPWAPFRVADWYDAIWRYPWTMITRRATGPRPRQKIWRNPQPVDTNPRLKKGRMGQ